LLVIVLVVGKVRGDCTDQENHEMQKKFTTCSEKYRNEHWDKTSSLDSDERLDATCLLISNIVDTCGNHWKECNVAEEIRRMKDTFIVHLTEQYSAEGDLNQCSVVREYKDSGRASYEYGDDVEDADGDVCSGPKTTEVQNAFQNCSHVTAATVYRTIQEIQDRAAITEHICQALNKIGSDCVELLSDCYNEEDLARTKEQHIQEMKKYFLKTPAVVEAKVGNDSLDNCQPAVEQVDIVAATVVPEVPVIEQFDETNDINGNDPYHRGSDDDDIEPVASTPVAEVTEEVHLPEPLNVENNDEEAVTQPPTSPADLHEDGDATAPNVETTTNSVYVKFANTPSHTTGRGTVTARLARDGSSAAVVIPASKLLLMVSLVCLVGLANWL